MTLPVSLEEAKRQLRILDWEQNEEIEDFIRDAAAWVEAYTGHLLEPRVVTERFTGSLVGVEAMDLRAWPIAADAVATVSYSLADGTSVAMPDGRIAPRSRPAWVIPAAGGHWSFPYFCSEIIVTVEAGYADPAEVPGNLRRAMLVLISGFDADREGGEMMRAAEETARRLCRRYRDWRA